MSHRLWLLFLVILLSGCFGRSIEDQAKLLGSKEFIKDAWTTSTQEQRGEMVASFLKKNNPTSLTANDVKNLLGPSTGYYQYDEYPAYLVGPTSVESEYGKGYLLAFVTDKNTGKILKVVFVPEVRK